MGLYKFTDPATGKSYNFTYTPPRQINIPIGGYNPQQVAKRAIRKKKAKKK